MPRRKLAKCVFNTPTLRNYCETQTDCFSPYLCFNDEQHKSVCVQAKEIPRRYDVTTRYVTKKKEVYNEYVTRISTLHTPGVPKEKLRRRGHFSFLF